MGNRRFLVLVLAVLLAGAGAIGYLVVRPAPPARILDHSAPLPAPGGYVMGSDSAPVEIVMFADFECPGCAQFATVTEPDVRTRIVNAGLARFRFLDAPIGSHPNSLDAHLAAGCAAAQGKFWEMHDQLYQNQLEWSALARGPKSRNPQAAFRGYGRAIALDLGAFDACIAARDPEPNIRANAAAAARAGVGGTPTFIVGRRMFPPGALPYDMLKAAVDSAIAEAAASR